MKHIKINYTNIAPEYKTPEAAGADIKAQIEEDIVMLPFKRAIINTGIFLEIPEGYEAQVRPRSGLAAKNGVTVLNTPGTIDSDYRGEVKVILINLGDESFTVKNGDRIAQLVIAPVIQGDFKKVDTLNDSNRGVGGFGSTGV